MVGLMRFHVLDTNLNQLGQFNDYSYAEWREDYAETGKLLLKCPYNTYNASVLQVNNLLYRHDIGRAMVIRQVEYEAATKTITVRGFTSLDLLAQRVINPSATVHTMTVTNIEQGIYDIVNTNARGLENFAADAPQGFTESTDTQFTGQKVLNSIISLASEASFGIKMDADYANKLHRFGVYKGTDRTYLNAAGTPHVIFNDMNLLGLKIVNDSGEFRNLIYVAGEGEGTARVVVTVPTDEPTGQARFEHWMDARNVRRESMTLARYRQILYSKGEEEINRRMEVLTFSGDPVTEGPGAHVFRKDYFLGDYITCNSKQFGMRFNAHVESYTEISQNNSTILKVQLGKPILNRSREVTDG